MSTILDALKKSEAEREQLEAHRGPYTPPSLNGRGPSWRWLGLLIIAVGVAVGLSWFGLRDTDPKPTTITATPITPTPLTSSSPATGSADRRDDSAAAEVNRQESAQAPLESGRTAQSPTNAIVDASSATDGDGAVNEPAEPAENDANRRAGVVVSQTQAEPLAASTSPSDLEESTRSTSGSEPARRTEPVVQQTNRVQPQDARPATSLPVYPALSRSVRMSVGALRLDMMVYNREEPTRSFALINLQRVVAGDTLEGGTEVESIEREGVILRYAQQRFVLKSSN